MNDARRDLGAYAAELRRAFDASFRTPAPERAAATRGAAVVVAVLGPRRFALPVSDVAYVASEVPIARHRGGADGLLGAATIRGRQLAVFAPRAGYDAPPVGAVAPRVVVSSEGGVALVCDAVVDLRSISDARDEASAAPPEPRRLRDLLPDAAFDDVEDAKEKKTPSP
jgi:chemotaxis signal transduction protein